MDTPGNDASSVAGMVAGGAQIVVFSTGRGTPSGNPIAPVIKITGNKITLQIWKIIWILMLVQLYMVHKQWKN